MHPADAALSRLSCRQLGLVTRSQALVAGITRHQIDGRISAGLLVPVHRGVLRCANVPLRRLLERVGERGRGGTAVLRRLLAERDDGHAPTESSLEDAVLRLLRAHGLPDPIRQHPVSLGGGRVVRIDLAYPEVLLGIEADGRIWHSGRADFESDRRRSNDLAGLGWTLLRFGWHDVRRGAGSALEVARLHRSLGRRRAS